MSLHPSCDGDREVAAPAPVFCRCVRASGPSGIALKAPSAFLASPCSRTSCYLEDQDSQEPASSSTFQISDYSWKYCKYVALERAKLSHWGIAAPHHRHLSEGSENWQSSDGQSGVCAFHVTQTGTVPPGGTSCLAWVHSSGTVLPQHVFSGDLLPCWAAYVEEANVSSAFCIKARTAQEGRRGWLCPLGFGRDHAEKPWWYLFWNSFCNGEQLLFQGKQWGDLQLLECAVKRPAQAWGSAGYFWRSMSPAHRNLEHRVILGPC